MAGAASESSWIAPFTGLSLRQFAKLVTVLRRAGVDTHHRGRPRGLSLDDRTLLVTAYWRTNLTMRQLAPLFGISKSAVDRIIDHLGPLLALQPRRRFAKDAVLTLIAGFWRDHRRILTALPTQSAVITRLTLLSLGLVALLPFPTALLAEYASQPETVALYAVAMAAIHAVHATLLLLTQRRVHPSPASSAAAARRRFTAQLGSSVLIFGLSAPLAFVNTEAAMWFWLTLIPAHYVLGHYPRELPPQ
ncbi:transposase family protein [Streptomyces sp. NPDC058476]|uniref:transposase family protein n=1 Tax=Streptomyces sp. NPDC058476 TaxID=3346519 RepID=UPI00365FEF81